MYFVKYNGEYLHDPRVAELVLTDLEFEGGENEASLCSFTMSCFHPLHDEIVERTSSRLVEIFDDRLGEEDPYFVGYVYEVGDAFDLQRTVKCKGELAFFNDSIVRPYTTQGNADVSASPNAYFEWLVQEHNAQVERAKQFSIGINQASDLDTNDYVLRADTTYPNTGEVIKSKMLETLGGVLRVRYEGGRRYVDYLAEWTDANTQTFEFGVNLTDFSKTDDALGVATFVVPLGANMKDTAYDYDDGYFVTADDKPVKNKEYFVRSFKKCGAMTSFADGVTYWEKKETDYFKTSDTKPFSGVDYYCKVFTKVKITKFAAGKTYYRLIDGVYTKVTGSFNKNYTYYTMKWEKQSVSSFDSSKTYWEKETYYAKTSDSAPKSGKDYYTLNRGSYSSKKDLGRFLKHETYYEYNEAYDESQRRLTVEKLANGPWDGDIEKIDDYVYSKSAVEKYGWIGATCENTDIKLRDNLLYEGVMALKAAISPATTIEVKAVDLSLVNPEFKPIRVGEHVRVKSRPHGFDSYMLCTGVKLDLNDPAKSEYTLGTTFDKLSGQQNKRIRSLNSAINKAYERAEAISDEAKAEAVEAIEEAKKAQTEAILANDAVVFARENIDEAVAEAVEAKEQADAAQLQADKAVQDAYDAAVKAEQAKDAADEAAAQVELIQTDVTEAKEAAQAAQDAAGQASTKADDALSAAGQAAQDAADAAAAAGTAQTKANEAYAAAGQAQAQVDVISGELDGVQADAAQLREDLEGQLESVTHAMAAEYTKKTELTETTLNLENKISESAAEVQRTISADYAKKTDLTSVQENLQTQVTQNASAIEQKASRTEVQEISEAAAKEASDKADAAQAAADAADAAAKAAQAEAEQAKSNAAASQSAANAAQAKADEAAANLATAEAELASVKGRVGATEADIAAAEAAVAAAKKAADDAQADADAAAGAASAAQSTADTAKANAAAAQSTANAAQSAANKAQDDVNALATRVTTTEAGIKNLNDSISLYAKKTEVAETLGGYYTKEQADAAIDLKADQITQSVGQTYQTKDAMSGYSTTAQMNSAINQKADSITQTVSSTYATKTELAAKASDYSIELYNGTGGNPKAVKFATVNYSTCDSNNGVSAKIGMISGHGNGVSYVFMQDTIINVAHDGTVTVDNFKHYGAETPAYDGAVRQYGDIFWVIDTTNKVVDLYCLMGQYARVNMTPWKRVTWSSGGTVTQYTSCTVYSSGTKVWANNSDIALASDLTELSTQISQTSEAVALRATKTELTAVSNAASAAQSTANTVKNDLASNYYTKTQTDAQIKVSADAITSTVSALEETLESDYSTTAEMNSAINQKADSITSSVSSTYATKSALSSTDTKATEAANAASKAQGEVDALETNVATNYATKTYVTQTASSITSTVSSVKTTADAAKSAIDGLEVGGRNLMLDSAAILLNASDQSNNGCSEIDGDYVKITPTNNGNVYNDGGFNTSEPRKKGETYTLSFEVLTPTAIGFYWYPSEHYAKTGYIEASGSWQKVKFTYTQTGNDAEGGTLFGLNGLTAGQVYRYRKVKLEKGNKATDWTPAPEDVEGYTNSSVEEALSQIQQLADKISMLVVDENGKTLMEQDSEGWTFNMADVASGLNAAAADAAAAAEELEKLAAYIRIKTENSAPLLELGDESAFKTQVTNEELRFMHGEEKVAYMNNEALHIERAVIEDKLNIGGFSWYESDDGGLAIVWEGSDE